jgi:hypothetical protein
MASTERTTLAVTSGGSFSGSAVLTNTSTAASPLGCPGDSYLHARHNTAGKLQKVIANEGGQYALAYSQFSGGTYDLMLDLDTPVPNVEQCGPFDLRLRYANGSTQYATNFQTHV